MKSSKDKKVFIRNMKLHNKLIVSYLLACIMPLLIISFTIYYLSASNIEQTSLEFASIYNSQILTSIDDFIEEYDTISKSVLIDNDIINYLGKEDQLSMNELITNKGTMQKLLMRIDTLKPDIKCVMLVSGTNTLYQYCSTNDTVNEKMVLNQPWFKQILESDDKLVITSIHDSSYYEYLNEDIVFTVGRVLLKPDGSYAGVLLIDLEPSNLIKLNNEFLEAQNNYDIKLVVTSEDGGIVYHSDILDGSETWRQLMENGYKSPVEKDKDLIVLSDKSKRGNLVVNTEIPRNKLLFKVGEFKYITIVAILLCVIFIIIISIILSYNITKPIKELQRSMKLAEEGKYSAIAPHKANDEIGGLITSYNKMITKIKNLIEDVYIAEIKHRHAKFLALQTQINPHMLYNTLESIRMKAIVNGDDEVALMIKILARMFKLTLGKDNSQNLIKHEVEYAKTYVQLQNIRFDNKFSLEVNLDDYLQNQKIIPLVFQPIIENCITHGVLDYDTLLIIGIEGEIKSEKDILIRIRDNGIGISEKKAEEINEMLLSTEIDKFNITLGEGSRKSIGLKNIAERIGLQYGEGYYLKVYPGKECGTVVEICIPFQ